MGRALIEHALNDGEHVVVTVRRDGALHDLQSRFPGLEVEMLA